MSLTDTRRLTWTLPPAVAAAKAPPILQIRPLRYIAEGHPGAMPPVQGLRALVRGSPTTQSEQEATNGLLCFQDLPAGQRRILLTDPERRFLPHAIAVMVPDRLPERATAPRVQASTLPRPTVLLRPAPGRAIPAGMTAIIGTLRHAEGHGVALGILSVQSVIEGRPTWIVTWTDQDGTFALWLPDEAQGRNAVAPPTVNRRFALHVPTPALAAALAHDFLGALPADLDGSAPATRLDLFREAEAEVLAPDGVPLLSEPGLLPLRPARTQRCDLRLR